MTTDHTSLLLISTAAAADDGKMGTDGESESDVALLSPLLPAADNAADDLEGSIRSMDCFNRLDRMQPHVTMGILALFIAGPDGWLFCGLLEGKWRSESKRGS